MLKQEIKENLKLYIQSEIYYLDSAYFQKIDLQTKQGRPLNTPQAGSACFCRDSLNEQNVTVWAKQSRIHILSLVKK